MFVTFSFCFVVTKDYDDTGKHKEHLFIHLNDDEKVARVTDDHETWVINASLCYKDTQTTGSLLLSRLFLSFCSIDSRKEVKDEGTTSWLSQPFANLLLSLPRVWGNSLLEKGPKVPPIRMKEERERIWREKEREKRKNDSTIDGWSGSTFTKFTSPCTLRIELMECTWSRLSFDPSVVAFFHPPFSILIGKRGDEGEEEEVKGKAGKGRKERWTVPILFHMILSSQQAPTKGSIITVTKCLRVVGWK